MSVAFDKLTVFTAPPPHFSPQMEISGVFCEFQKRLLFLQRSKSVSQGGTWSIPGGKIEKNEKPYDAAIRELYEETGLQIRDPKSIGELYVRMPHLDYIFYMFQKTFSEAPLVILNHESTLATWKTLDEAFHLPLILGGKEALEAYQKRRHVD